MPVSGTVLLPQLRPRERDLGGRTEL